MQKRFKVWVTKYALSEGILAGEAEDINDNAINFYWRISAAPIFLNGKDWHRTEESAIERAEKMRTRKIESLRKKIAKLESMTFVRGDT